MVTSLSLVPSFLCSFVYSDDLSFLRATEAIGVKREVISTALAYVGPTIVLFCNKESSILYPEKASKESWGSLRVPGMGKEE